MNSLPDTNPFFLPDKNKAPFLFSTDKSVQMQGNEMGFFLSALAGKKVPDKTKAVILTCLAFNGIGKESPFYKAAAEIAELIDTDARCGTGSNSSGTFSGLGNGYHNARHMQEVILNAQFLISINNATQAIDLTPYDKALLLISALIHDLGHNGLSNVMNGEKHNFLLEEASVELALPYLTKHFTDDALEIISYITAMVYCTDVNCETNYLNLALAKFRNRQKLPFPQSSVLPRLLPIFTNPKIAELAAMLCDADIATSVAYNFSCCWDASLRLADEMAGHNVKGQEIDTLANLIKFLEEHADLKSMAGMVLYSNFDLIRNNTKTMLMSEEADQSSDDSY